MPLGGCAQAFLSFFLARCARGGCKWSETELALILRTLAVPLGSCANACANFFLARCARGSCKWSETGLRLIYVRSLCRWAVARTLAGIFSWLAVLGAAARCRKQSLR